MGRIGTRAVLYVVGPLAGFSKVRVHFLVSAAKAFEHSHDRWRREKEPAHLSAPNGWPKGNPCARIGFSIGGARRLFTYLPVPRDVGNKLGNLWHDVSKDSQDAPRPAWR